MSGPGSGGRLQKNIWRHKGHGFFQSIEDIHARIMKLLTLKWINKEGSKQISKSNFSHRGIIARPLKTTAKKIFRATRIKDGPSFSESAIRRVWWPVRAHATVGYASWTELPCPCLYTSSALLADAPKSVLIAAKYRPTSWYDGSGNHLFPKLHQISESSIFFPPPYNAFFTQNKWSKQTIWSGIVALWLRKRDIHQFLDMTFSTRKHGTSVLVHRICMSSQQPACVHPWEMHRQHLSPHVVLLSASVHLEVPSCRDNTLLCWNSVKALGVQNNHAPQKGL